MEWEVGEVTFYRNLGIFPIFGEPQVDVEVEVLDEGIQNGRITVGETGTVETVVVEQKDGPDTLIVDGEEVWGAFQNRVFTTSIWMEAGKTVYAPVVCVEEGRWNGGKTFSHSVFCAYPSLRALTAQTVYQSLRKGGGYHADQGKVWNDVKRTLSTLQVHSETQLMSQSFLSTQAELAGYFSSRSGVTGRRSSRVKQRITPEILPEEIVDFHPLPGQTGFLAFTQKRILGMDVFGNLELLKKLHAKLLLSYALDALRDSLEAGGEMDADQALKFLSYADDWKNWSTFPGVGKGEERRWVSSSAAGKVLASNGSFLHFSLFPIRRNGKRTSAE